MKAIAIVPGAVGSRLVQRPEPSITAQNEVKVRVICVGICGTDREEVSGGRAQVPEGQKELVIGHEMFSQVVGVGRSVTRVKTGALRCIHSAPRMRGMLFLFDEAFRHVSNWQILRERDKGIRRLPDGIRS